MPRKGESVAKPTRLIGLTELRERLAPLARRISWVKPSLESDLRYTILPPYEIPGIIVVTGLIVENRGQRPAHNVRITIGYDVASTSLIHHLQVVSEEDYILRGGGEQHHFATIRLRRMSPDSKVFVYLATSDLTLPQVTVTSYEKPTA